jgi:hypothetical protein
MLITTHKYCIYNNIHKQILKVTGNLSVVQLLLLVWKNSYISLYVICKSLSFVAPLRSKTPAVGQCNISEWLPYFTRYNVITFFLKTYCKFPFLFLSFRDINECLPYFDKY